MIVLMFSKVLMLDDHGPTPYHKSSVICMLVI